MLQGGVGMPTLWAAGVQDNLDYLVIDLLGPSLDNLYKKLTPRVMGLPSVLQIALQVVSTATSFIQNHLKSQRPSQLTRLEFMHARGLLHRDIQLGNCVVGLGENASTLYMIDFGFSKQYIDPRTHRHIPDSKKKRSFIGNYWFTSVNVHCRGKGNVFNHTPKSNADFSQFLRAETTWKHSL